MKQIVIVWEGECEERFCCDILAPHLSASAIVNPVRAKAANGSTFAAKLDRLFDPLAAYCKQFPTALVTTMIDFARLQGLPDSARRATATSQRKVLAEDYLTSRLMERLGGEFRKDRWLPYVQMHEFEALLFSDPAIFASELRCPLGRVSGHLKGHSTPEDIDGDEHPSKRIANFYPRYRREKVSLSASTTRAIGLPTLRRACPLFSDWIGRLEAYARS